MSGRRGFRVVIPARTTGALPRLAAGPSARRRLALAMLEDTIEAALSSRLTNEVVVVASDEDVAATAARLRVAAVPSSGSAGLVDALRSAAPGIDAVTTSAGTCILAGDVPAATRDDIDTVLRAAGPDTLVVRDLAGQRPTMLADGRGWPDVALLESTPPRAARDRRHHLLAPGVQADVDTVAGLRIAEYIGVGAATTAVLPSLRLPWTRRPEASHVLAV